MLIGIDARLWGETGVGRYIRNLVINLQVVDSVNNYVLFIKPKDEVDVKAKIKDKRFIYSVVDIHWHSIKEQTLFGNILNRQNLDLMHFPYFSLPITYRKPFVVTIHDLIIHHFSTGNASTLPLPLYAVKRLGFKRVLSHGLKRSKKIIVPLESVKAELEETFYIDKEKIFVTREGFDPSLIKDAKPSTSVKKEVEKGKYFLYVGNAYPHKNVGFLLSSFFEFARKNMDYRLILVGQDDYFYNQLRAVTTSPSVSFLHDLTDSDLGYIYRWSEGFVSASLMEGFGLPPLEAMAFNTPVLLSDIPSFKEVCANEAIYFNPQDKKSLITGFEKIANLSSKQRENLEKSQIKRLSQFSFRQMAVETLKVYESSISL